VDTFELDWLHTFVTFSAPHLVVGRVRGRFEAVQGTIRVASTPQRPSPDAEAIRLL